MTISFTTTNKDAELIRRITDRAAPLLGGTGITGLELSMDITACHANGNPLDLEALLAFPQFDFSHDTTGIYRHLDRTTGKLTDCFVPRSTRRTSPQEDAMLAIIDGLRDQDTY